MDQRASRVLIVDDMHVNRMILSSLLAVSGVASDQADSAQACLSLCEKNDYDLILLDHRMPDTDGVDTLLMLKQLFERQKRTVPVVCHTTEEGRQNINLYKAAGFADVLIKPIDPTLLSEVLLRYLPEKDKLTACRDEVNHMVRVQSAISGEAAGTDDQDPALSSTGFGENGADVLSEPSAPETLDYGEIDVSSELDLLPMWMKTVPHLDLTAGIRNCDGAVDYIDALYVFYTSMEEKADELEHFYQEGDLTMLRLHAHSLKSLSRLIGAKKLCEYAKNAEYAADEGDTESLKEIMPDLLSDFRMLRKHLAPLPDDENIKHLLYEDPSEKDALPPADHSRTVLFIHNNPGIVSTGIDNRLREARFTVISIPDEPDKIITHRFDADLVVYFPVTDEDSHIGITMNLLGEICQDDNKLLCLIGDQVDLKLALSSNGAHRVSKTYPRPMNMTRFLDDITAFSLSLQEFHRKKELFIVDDDADYRSVLQHWLSPSYHISCFGSGQELIEGLRVSIPDLILMDYEMPGMNGFEVMQQIRSDSKTEKIPVIFLTGKNDRDHVYKILKHKPDGYLLKTSQKDSLVDAIGRYFSESLFRESQL